MFLPGAPASTDPLMNKQSTDNTNKLIRTGWLVVSIPVAVVLLAPLALTAAWVITDGKFLLWPLFAAMFAGLVFSFFVYRFCSVRWLRWALKEANNLPHLKRRAIKSRLISPKGESLFDTSYFLDEQTQVEFDRIDAAKAQADSVNVPPVTELYSRPANRQIAAVAALLFAVAAVVIFIFLKRNEWGTLAGFSPLLLISIIFLVGPAQKKRILSIDEKGIRTAGSEWAWSDLQSVRCVTRRSSSSGPGRITYFTSHHLLLLLTTTTGKKTTISLGNSVVDFDIEEYIAVYRLRHANRKAGDVLNNNAGN